MLIQHDQHCLFTDEENYWDVHSSYHEKHAHEDVVGNGFISFFRDVLHDVTFEVFSVCDEADDADCDVDDYADEDGEDGCFHAVGVGFEFEAFVYCEIVGLEGIG